MINSEKMIRKGIKMSNMIEKMKNTRILATVGIAGLILGTIFPYVSYSFFGSSLSMSLWDYWQGKVVLVLAIANLLFIFRDVVEKYVPSLFNTDIGKKIADMDNSKGSLVPTILSIIFVLYLQIRLDVDFDNYSLGFYLLWIGVIALVAYAFLHKNHDEFQMK